MNIAFYAPMKSPHHPRPSGDRLIGRMLIKALEYHGHNVKVMSDLRAWEGQGDYEAQSLIRDLALREADQLIEKLHQHKQAQKTDVWLTYHLYHKAPDWIGPHVAAALKLPYVVTEASYAAKQLTGPWSVGCQQSLHALALARAIISLNPQDIPALKALPQCRDKHHSLLPFMDFTDIEQIEVDNTRQQFADQHGLDLKLPWLICVAMMRDDAKLKSYTLLAKSIARLKSPYQLLIVGAGKAQDKVHALFRHTKHTSFLGQLDRQQTLQALQASDVFVWPAVNEAICMAILEAQVCGLPVVAGNSGAVSKIVRDGQTGFILPPEDCKNMAKLMDQLLSSVPLRQAFSQAALENIRQHHSLQAGADGLQRVLQPLV